MAAEGKASLWGSCSAGPPHSRAGPGAVQPPCGSSPPISILVPLPEVDAGLSDQPQDGVWNILRWQDTAPMARPLGEALQGAVLPGEWWGWVPRASGFCQAAPVDAEMGICHVDSSWASPTVGTAPRTAALSPRMGHSGAPCLPYGLQLCWPTQRVAD